MFLQNKKQYLSAPIIYMRKMINSVNRYCISVYNVGFVFKAYPKKHRIRVFGSGDLKPAQQRLMPEA